MMNYSNVTILSLETITHNRVYVFVLQYFMLPFNNLFNILNNTKQHRQINYRE